MRVRRAELPRQTGVTVEWAARRLSARSSWRTVAAGEEAVSPQRQRPAVAAVVDGKLLELQGQLARPSEAILALSLGPSQPIQAVEQAVSPRASAMALRTEAGLVARPRKRVQPVMLAGRASTVQVEVVLAADVRELRRPLLELRAGTPTHP